MQTEHVFVGNIQNDLGRVNEILEDYLTTLRIFDDDSRRFNLLAEEAIRFMDTLAGEDIPIEVWFEGDARVSNICLRLNQKMDVDRTEELVSVSSSGTNSAEKTFIDQLRTFFVKPEKPSWSLKEYQASLMARREMDKFDQNAWDNLERSVLANLASDITVAVNDNSSLMVISKDFTSSLKTIGSRKPIIVTDSISYNQKFSSIDKAIDRVDQVVDQLKLSNTNKLRVKLIFEETIGMMKAMAVDFDAIVYAEKYAESVAVKLSADTEMDIDKKSELLDVASDKKNAMAKGFMGKISDLIETSALSYESMLSLKDGAGSEPMGIYNGMGVVPFGSLGMYGDIGAGYDADYMGEMMWSLNDYRENLDENNGDAYKEAWDELEKSIVANIAEDVIVGIKKNHVEMTIIYKLK